HTQHRQWKGSLTPPHHHHPHSPTHTQTHTQVHTHTHIRTLQHLPQPHTHHRTHSGGDPISLYTVQFQRVIPGGGHRKIADDPTPSSRDEVLPSFSHMQGRNNSLLKYTEEHENPILDY